MKLKIIVVLFCLVPNLLIGQKAIKEFKLELNDSITLDKLCNIDIIDLRPDTSNCGVIQTGALNKKRLVKFLKPLKVQLNEMLDSLAKGTNDLTENFVLILRQFSFAEVTTATSESGSFYFRAGMYKAQSENYLLVNSVDTVISFQKFDVTKTLLSIGNKSIVDFVIESVNKTPMNNDTYSFKQLQEIEKIEKSKIPLYKNKSLLNGVYLSFDDFKTQTPNYIDFKIKKKKNNDIKSISVWDSAEKEYKKINKEYIYAFVNNGQMYIATKYGYYPLFKVNNDFFFTGRDRVNADSGGVFVAGLLFGAVGGALASNSSASMYFYMKIDHTNGMFIHLKEIKK